jgi:hypothetical protein
MKKLATPYKNIEAFDKNIELVKYTILYIPKFKSTCIVIFLVICGIPHWYYSGLKYKQILGQIH